MMGEVLPQIDLGRCTLCGQCVSACPVQAVILFSTGPRIVTPERCTYCTACEGICPAGAITCTFEIVWGA